MTSERPLVSVVVVTWNGASYVPRCVESVGGQTLTDHELIVVDNGSTDGVLDYLKGAGASGIARLIENGANLGFAEANNQGIHASRGKYVALLNSDAIADARWLERLTAVAEADASVGMVGSKILTDKDPSVFDGTGILIYPDGMSRARGRLKKDTGQYDTPEEILLPSGCAAFYRRAMLDEIGFFDKSFFAYCEDTDLGLRGRLAGWRCLYEPKATVRHIYSGGERAVSETKALLVERNHLWVVAKNFPLDSVLVAFFYAVARYFAQGWAVLCNAGMGGRFVKKHSKGRLAVVFARAYVEALRGLPEMLRKRRAIQSSRKITPGQFRLLLKKHKIDLSALVNTN